MFFRGFNFNMRILRTDNSTTKPNFKHYYNEVHSNGKLKYRNNTCFFRICLDWINFGKFIEQKYQNVPKVNIINHACSIGEEAYSLAIIIEKFCPNLAKKCYPIIAKDIDNQVIEKAKEGIVTFDFYEFQDVTNICDKNFSDFFNGKNIVFQWNELSQTNDIITKIQPNLLSKIEFSQGNLLEDSKNLPKENTILFCRNMWLYLDENEKETLAKNLSNALDDSSLVVIGNADEGASSHLQRNGFYQVENLNNVFQKSKYNSIEQFYYAMRDLIK